MFSLAIYDTLTPDSMTDGATVAGTGTIDPEGKVGPIGGIQQKIAAARDTGADLFMVPPDNCDEALERPTTTCSSSARTPCTTPGRPSRRGRTTRTQTCRAARSAA